MNEYLAQIYGTMSNVAPEEENLQKEAAVQTLIKLAEAEGINLDELSDEEVSNLLTEVEKEQEKAEGSEKEATAALEAGDLIGRTAAHAYVAELREIEKQAADPTIARAQRTLESRSTPVRSNPGATAKGPRLDEKSTFRKMTGALRGAGKSVSRGTESLGKRLTELATMSGKGAASRMNPRIAKAIGGSAAGLGALGVAGAGYGLKKMMDKKSADEAFEQAATERAWEMLAEAGYDVEKMAQDSQVEDLINQRAFEMLEQAGYVE